MAARARHPARAYVCLGVRENHLREEELKLLGKIAEKFGFSRGSELDGAVRTVQRALSQAGQASLGHIIEALVAIIEQQGWRPRFGSFPEFVVGASPHGRGMQSLQPLEMLRELLLDLGY